MSIQQFVAAGGPLLILLIAAFDVFCLTTARQTPGQVIQWWARDHPLLAAAFTAFVGAFMAHIFWHT